MYFKNLINLIVFLGFFYPIATEAFTFIDTREDLKSYVDPSIIMIASPGRSGSTLLTNTVQRLFPERMILKTHILPPSKAFKGKILFVFSDPDRAAESALHITLNDSNFGYWHFIHLESSDQEWLNKIGNSTQQTRENNLLSYDALGVAVQLREWLERSTTPCDCSAAQIMAIKYENLWDAMMITKIREFLGNDSFEMPVKMSRGKAKEDMDPQAAEFIAAYNLGSVEDPRYAAYDEARTLWEAAPPFQFLKINEN